jgi:hypothetical protein
MRVVLTVVAIVVVAGGMGVGLRWVQQLHNSKAKVPGAFSHKLTPVERAQQAALVGHADYGQKIITDELKNTNLSANDKYQLYYQQGATYQNSGDNKSGAIDYYKKAIQLITGPLSADDTKADQQIIRDLGGQP